MSLIIFVFNPVGPHTALSDTQITEVEPSSLCGGTCTESTYNTVVVDVGSAGSIGCVAQVPSKTRL